MPDLKRYFVTGCAVLLCAPLVTAQAQLAHDKSGIQHIKIEDLRGWLGYLASDELEGRRTFSEGLGLAAAYIATELKSWNVQPGGDNGSYFQRVLVRGIKSTNSSSLEVEVNGKTRVFKNGEGVTFPSNVGARRTFASHDIVFAGYGIDAPFANHNDFENLDVRDKVVIWIGAEGPRGLDMREHRRLLTSRARYATDQGGAAAVIGETVRFGGRGGARGGNVPTAGGAPQQRGGQSQLRPDFTTAERLDKPIPPSVNASDEFFEFLFSTSDHSYARLKEMADRRESLPHFPLKNVTLTFKLDADYEVLNTQYTRNVVGIVSGTDAALKDTYVAFGAHYDHVGYAEGEISDTPNGPRREGAVGRVKDGAIEDRIWNGADDDGSGSTVMLAAAKAFALGPKPKRSLLFVWHTGEERGLWGSRYFVDHAGMDVSGQIVAQINMDMVGRNRDDKPEEANTVYLVGSDRISTELHNLSVDANASLPRPLKLDYEMNDPTDLEQVYYRSDHYSYAAKGIPVVFLTTGLHPDYHVNTDGVESINFEKMTRIAQLVYEIGRQVASLDHAPTRDNKGARVGKGFQGKIQQ